ncbi:MAG: GAF domain-containing protein, partial [Planctomycetota bacterium]
MVEPAPAQKQRPGRVRENAETRLLYRITKALLDRQTPLEAALEEVVHHLAEYGFVRTSIAIYDQPTREVRIEASHGLSQDELRRGRYQPGEGIIGQVVEDGEAAVVPAIAEEPQFLDRTGSRAGVDRARTAFICAPIVNPARREVVGTVSVDIPVAQYEDVDA